MLGRSPQPGAGPPALFAWLVHLFTASSAVVALVALNAIDQQRWGVALLWLFVSLMVDGVDGSLARWAQVKQRASRIDGDALDLFVDYLTYVFVPAIFIWRAEMLPPAVALWLVAGVLLSSLYVFARRDMKTEDNYFLAFPHSGTLSPSTSTSWTRGRRSPQSWSPR
jgi:phosphatidylcholine synthase